LLQINQQGIGEKIYDFIRHFENFHVETKCKKSHLIDARDDEMPFGCAKQTLIRIVDGMLARDKGDDLVTLTFCYENDALFEVRIPVTLIKKLSAIAILQEFNKILECSRAFGSAGMLKIQISRVNTQKCGLKASDQLFSCSADKDFLAKGKQLKYSDIIGLYN